MLTATPPIYCDDCGPKRGLPVDGRTALNAVPGFYGRCGFCGIIRAVYGDDPDPIKARKIRIPEWPKTSLLR